MSLLTVAQAKAFIESDLEDSALQMLIDAEEADINAIIGGYDSQIDSFNDETLSNIIVLTRRASSITTITEKIGGDGYYETTTLSSDDYLFRSNRILERLASGTNPRTTWGNIVTVTYAPVDDRARRKMVIIHLLKLSIEYNGLSSEKIGDYAATQKEYQEERGRLISRLSTAIL
jgi:hypothetical protein